MQTLYLDRDLHRESKECYLPLEKIASGRDEIAGGKKASKTKVNLPGFNNSFDFNRS
jgi:hypothetical protein